MAEFTPGAFPRTTWRDLAVVPMEGRWRTELFLRTLYRIGIFILRVLAWLLKAALWAILILLVFFGSIIAQSFKRK